MKNLISYVAKKIINILDKDNQCSEIELLQMFFGLQNILYNVVITASILLISLITDNFIETLLIFTFFGILRIIAGGYHCNSVEKCIITTSLVMIGGGKFIQSIHISQSICITICILVNIVFFSYIPKGTHNNPYSLVHQIINSAYFEKCDIISL